MRRFTEDFDNDRIHLELMQAQSMFIQGRALYEKHNYFDCVEKLAEALDCFDTNEPPTTNLKLNLPTVYRQVKDCYLLTAKCYILLDQQRTAKQTLNLILQAEPNDPQTLYIRGQANEIRPDTFHKAKVDY